MDLPESGNPSADQAVMQNRDRGRIHAGVYTGARRAGAPALLAALITLITAWMDESWESFDVDVE